nr:VWA domain-containing protein [Chthoniobacterales bacterium]
MEYLNGWQAGLLFGLLSLPVILLGMRSLNGLGQVRKWVAIGVRMLVILLFVLILAGGRWQQENKNVEVIVLRDISESTAQVHDYPGKTLQSSLDDWLRQLSDSKNAEQTGKKNEDRIGVISFHDTPLIDAMPNTRLVLDARAIRTGGNGTDVASAIQLALATLGRDAMHRLVLVWDGNQTLGDIESAITAAAAQNVPIDVVPLEYSVQSEVLLERFVAPTWKRENEPFTVDVILRSTNATPVTGKLTVLHQNLPMDLDGAAGMQPTKVVTLQPGLNVERVRVPSLEGSDVIHQFKAVFEAENVTAEVAQGANAKAQGSGADTLLANNAAEAFTFVRGKGKVLYVDNVEQERGKILRDALT